MIDLFAIVVTSIAVWIVLIRAIRLDRTTPWFQKVNRPAPQPGTADPGAPVWRRRQ